MHGRRPRTRSRCRSWPSGRRVASPHPSPVRLAEDGDAPGEATVPDAIRAIRGYDPHVTRFYDLDEADALVPELQELCQRLRDQRADLVALRDELALREASLEGAAANTGVAGATLTDDDADVRRLRLRMRGLVDQMQAEVAWLDERSVLLRDISTGLLDVAALVSGRQVWLCWQLGEDGSGTGTSWPPGSRVAGRSPTSHEPLAGGRTTPTPSDATSVPGTILQDGRAKAYRPLPPTARAAAYREGVAAYRRGDFFAAHEHLEPAWMGSDDLAERELHQGLIKLAAGFVHAVRGNPAGMAKNLAGARARIAAAAEAGAGAGVAGGRIAGLDLGDSSSTSMPASPTSRPAGRSARTTRRVSTAPPGGPHDRSRGRPRMRRPVRRPAPSGRSSTRRPAGRPRARRGPRRPRSRGAAHPVLGGQRPAGRDPARSARCWSSARQAAGHRPWRRTSWRTVGPTSRTSPAA